MDSCRKQIVTFLASSLTEKDLFGLNSEDSLNDLYSLLSNDTGGGMIPLMKDLADELTEQDVLNQVNIDFILHIIYCILHTFFILKQKSY
jgi:hypothetical protein